jgi:hypothetical protein
LKSNFIPKNVTPIDGSVFVKGQIALVKVQEENKHLIMDGDFLTEVIDSTLSRYFGCSGGSENLKVDQDSWEIVF